MAALTAMPERSCVVRLPMAIRRRFAIDRPAMTGPVSRPQRDPSAAALETVALVLDEAAPLPECADDVEELAQRLRGHISQLGLLLPSGASSLCSARQLASASVPDGYMPSRVHLIKLAEVTQALVATVQARGDDLAKPTRGRRWPKPGINVLRGSVFAVAFACLILAASVPRP